MRGCSLFDVRRDALQMGVGQTRMCGETMPSRSARSLICAGDSSPETYRTGARPEPVEGPPPSARAAQSWMSKVLLPMPGSPLIRTTEPGTIPPPSTRLNSPIGTGMRS